ncbi:TPA: hypothetical protein HNJ18_19095 [Escherichia coli]|nr:hypothetical protein [Escherichia coli]
MFGCVIVCACCGFCLVIAEFTGRHPASCCIQRLGIYPGSSSQEPFYMQKKARVGSGNSMRYLHCHFYRVDFNQGL